MSGGVVAAIWSGAATVAEAPLQLMLRRRVAAGKEIAARLPERRGIEPAARPEGLLLWMHAASVGETISVLPVLHAMAAIAPEVTVLLTTGTVTSARLAEERLPAGGLHRFVPLDVPRWVGRFLDHWRPDAACFVESEIWPNILAAAAKRGLKLALLNARLSQRSFARWRLVPGFARHLFGRFELIWARSAEDGRRLSVLSGAQVVCPGDLKFAAPPLPADADAYAALGEAWAGRPIWVAASLHPGEDVVVAAAHGLLTPRFADLLTVIVPRHPRRGDAMAAAAPMARRSRKESAASPGIYLADTLGELGLFYRLAACAFIGGSLVPHGGQNPLEAARLDCPVAMGPHRRNFEQACFVLGEAGALAEVHDAASLAAWAGGMLGDAERCRAVGQAGHAAADRWAALPEQAARMLLGMMRR